MIAFRYTSLHRCWWTTAAIFATVITIRAEEARRFRPHVREPGPGATSSQTPSLDVSHVFAHDGWVYGIRYFLARPRLHVGGSKLVPPRDTVVPEVGVVEFLEHFRIVVRAGQVERGSDCMPTRQITVHPIHFMISCEQYVYDVGTRFDMCLVRTQYQIVSAL